MMSEDFVQPELNMETNPALWDNSVLQVQVQLQPLQIPEIVSVIVKYMESENLEKSRFVCKVWNEEIIPEMREKSTFSFNSAQQIETFMTYGQHFFGFKKLKLKYKNISKTWVSNNASYSESQLQWEDSVFKFLSTHGKLLKGVELDFCKSLPLGTFTVKEFRKCLLYFQNLEYMRLTGFPCFATHNAIFPTIRNGEDIPIVLDKLTILYIDSVHPSGSFCRHSDPSQSFYIQLLRLAPNLNELHLGKSQPDSSNSISLDGCQCALIGYVNPPNLKRLYFHTQLCESLEPRLCNSTMNIQKLVFDDLRDFEVNFESSLDGNTIEMEVIPSKYFRHNLPAGEMINYIQRELSKCESGISCTLLFKEFLNAFERKLTDPNQP